jgi:uncharacterized delta-60 repeat protein
MGKLSVALIVVFVSVLLLAGCGGGGGGGSAPVQPWAKSYGGADNDLAQSIQQTSDGGYIIAGSTVSFGAGSADFWVLKLNSDGNIGTPGTWEKRYGGADSDYARSIQQTSDGGYIVAGQTYSSGAGGGDFWVLKLDSDGNIGTPGTWQKTYGGAGYDCANSIQQTSDGGYIVAGPTSSFGAGARASDFWVLKLDSDGNIGTPGTWQKTYSGIHVDGGPYSIYQTSDGGYIVTGYTMSFGDFGNSDFWVLKLKSDGTVSWQQRYGGADGDSANSIQQTSDGGYIVAGSTDSFGAGDYDLWVLKLRSNGTIEFDPASGAHIEDTTADVDVTPTSVSGVDTIVTGVPTSATVTLTDTDVVATDATIEQQAP